MTQTQPALSTHCWRQHRRNKIIIGTSIIILIVVTIVVVSVALVKRSSLSILSEEELREGSISLL